MQQQQQQRSEVAKVFVVTSFSKTITIACLECDTIESVKRKIRDKDAIPPGNQRLIYGGKQLEDGRTLSSYGISDQSTLILAARGNGGVKKGDARREAKAIVANGGSFSGVVTQRKMRMRKSRMRMKSFSQRPGNNHIQPHVELTKSEYVQRQRVCAHVYHPIEISNIRRGLLKMLVDLHKEEIINSCT